MALYNLTSIVAGNETGLLSFVQGINTVLMDGWLGAIFLIGIFIVRITSFIFTTNDVGKSVTASSFISFTLAISLTALELLSPTGLFITLIIAAISVATTWSRT